MSSAALVEIHHELDRVFELARELLVVGDGAHASRALAVYAALTARHAADEEALLLPHLPDDARWPASLYTGQHRKLLLSLDRVVGAIAQVDRAAPRWRLSVLAALDALIPVMHLAEHHHLAEEQELFPSVPAAQLAAIAAAFPADLAAHADTLARCRAALAAR